ncbi:hypothetical protein [Flavobacterium selenitireducens]|uniref:hypothetical protein n=1 Tax=Flavobacterium selenitireducens TaxID=2722704 RepID=UPI00168B759E|nr:hypothetical protein [Flavobacterium selenitireducens]MBD3581029.1 hypothetical protein [Flavobacterium selenitireducens]
MPLTAQREKISTVIFRIPHVHNLLIFKDVLKNKDALVSILVEILKLGDPDVLYLGYDNLHSLPKDILLKDRDSAIVRISFPNKKIICKEPEQTIMLAIIELQRLNGQISIASDTLSHERNITAIALSADDSCTT